MTTLFQTYEEEYRDGVRTIQDESAALRQSCDRKAVGYKAPPATGPGSRVQRGAHLTTVLAQVRELVNSMEYEANDLPAAHRQTAKERITEYRTNLRSLEDGINRLKADASAADRLDLLGDAEKRKAGGAEGAGGAGAAGDLDDATKAHRMTMMDNTAKVRDASGKLRQAERLLNDTETVGNEALTNLRNQTETMQHIQETTIAVDEEVSEARKIIGGMQKMMIKHKLILIAIIVVLIFLIVVAVYVSVSKNRSNSTTSSTLPTGDPITSIAPSLMTLARRLVE